MKRPSFRLRLALLSTTLAGGALLGFGAISWWQIYSAKLSRLDAEINTQLLQIPRFQGQERWQAYANTLPYILGGNSKTAIVLRVLDAAGNLVYPTNSTAEPELEPALSQGFRSAPPPPVDRPPPLLPGSEPPGHPQPPPAPPRPYLTTERTTHGTWRIGAVNFPNRRVAIAVNLQVVDQDMATIRNIFAILIPAVLLLIAGGAWLLAGSALRPIHQLTDRIQRVTAKGLDQRIPVGATDIEFVELIQVFNQMLERLERSFTQASRFSGDAAHELKTPLTILQGELERSLQQVEPGSEVQQRLSTLLDEVRRLSSIMRKLLLLSLADAGKMSLYPVEINLTELLTEMTEDVELLAPHLKVQTKIATNLQAWGDRDLLVQVLHNLLSNAIKYNLPAGWIQIQAHQTGKKVRIRICNASKDIPATDRHRLFDRFHRGDPARTRQVEGTGLGLNLSREIARAHRGDLILEAAAPGQTAFTLTLPIAV